MMRGLYTADTGMVDRSRALEVIGNNISNLSTVGYKKDRTVSVPFGQYLTYQDGTGTKKMLGNINHGVLTDEVDTIDNQGALKETGNPLDFAIAGDGFFTVRQPDGKVRLTRNGQFSINAGGYLTDGNGNLVLGKKGTIRTEGKSVSVSTSGQISLNGVAADTLLITCPQDLKGLVKRGNNLFEQTKASLSKPFQGQIRQGFEESSNVDPADEMSRMIESSRSYQSCAKVIQMMDKVLDKSVNDVGRLY